MVDCRSLIEFCRAYEHHKHMNKFNSNIKKHYNNQKYSFCSDRSPFAALDAIILLCVLGSLGFLIIPYFNLLFTQVSPIICDVFIEVINNSPVAYFVGLMIAFIGIITLIVIWEIIDLRSRKCGNPNCQGLRKAVEFDIQLESEECIKCLRLDPDLNSNAFYNYGVKPLELGEERKELEAELKRMAPHNGRTVLIFRAPCGCPAGMVLLLYYVGIEEKLEISSSIKWIKFSFEEVSYSQGATSGNMLFLKKPASQCLLSKYLIENYNSEIEGHTEDGEYCLAPRQPSLCSSQ